MAYISRGLVVICVLLIATIPCLSKTRTGYFGDPKTKCRCVMAGYQTGTIGFWQCYSAVLINAFSRPELEKICSMIYNFPIGLNHSSKSHYLTPTRRP